MSGERVDTPLNRERKYQQSVHESHRNSWLNDRAAACRNDSSRC